jgi:hypothetical protein
MSTERRVFGLLMSQLIVSFSVGTLVGSHDRWTTAFSAATILCSAVGVLRTVRSLRRDRSRLNDPADSHE